MNAQDLPFNRRAVKPFECLQGGWQLIKNDYWLFLGISVVGIIIGSFVPMGLLMGPVMCGIYLCLLRRERGQPVTFDMLFQGFNYFVQSLIATLLMIGPMIALMLPLYVFFFVGMAFSMPAPPQNQGEPPDPSTILMVLGVFGLFMLAIFAIAWLFQVLFFFTYPRIVDRKLSGWEAVQLSWRAAFGNLGGVLGLTLLNGLLGLAGLLACCIGVFFVLPVTFAATAVAYRQVFPLEASPPQLPADPSQSPSRC